MITASLKYPVCILLTAAERQADALLELTGNVANLNSSQVDQLVSQLQDLLSGPTVSLALGNTSVHVVSNLLGASAETLADSSSRWVDLTVLWHIVHCWRNVTQTTWLGLNLNLTLLCTCNKWFLLMTMSSLRGKSSKKFLSLTSRCVSHRIDIVCGGNGVFWMTGTQS